MTGKDVEKKELLPSVAGIRTTINTVINRMEALKMEQSHADTQSMFTAALLARANTWRQ